MGHGSPLRLILIELNLIGCDDFSFFVADAMELSNWSLYFDGACRGNEKVGSYGIASFPPKGNTILLGLLLGNYLSNNIVEYQAILIGLRALIILEATHVHVFGDSQL